MHISIPSERTHPGCHRTYPVHIDLMERSIVLIDPGITKRMKGASMHGSHRIHEFIPLMERLNKPISKLSIYLSICWNNIMLDRCAFLHVPHLIHRFQLLPNLAPLSLSLFAHLIFRCLSQTHFFFLSKIHT